MVTINYQLIDTFENYKEFETVGQAIAWMEGIGENYFQYVDITDDKDNYVDSYSGIVEKYKKANIDPKKCLDSEMQRVNQVFTKLIKETLK